MFDKGMKGKYGEKRKHKYMYFLFINSPDTI